MDNGASSYRRFLNGDDEGLTLIIYKDGLILYLNGYVNNIYVAEDIMEETFFKLAVKKPKFNENSSFKTWLYTIGRNVAIDYIRRNYKFSTSSIEDMENYIKEEKNLENLYIKSERKIIIHKAMSNLKPEYYQVLWLCFFEEFSNEETAKSSSNYTYNSALFSLLHCYMFISAFEDTICYFIIALHTGIPPY